ncbi:MAG TPA: helix-turn-helix domain-containing protein [Devosia sp.]|nr:helix-turn-helix domain-containing protein [Devosia sp.]
MATRRIPTKTGCPVETAIAIVGGVWKPLIVYALMDEKRRFGELSRLVPNATQRVLSLHLRELEADGVLTRTVFPDVPLRVEYELTETGRSLTPILYALNAWGTSYQAKQGAG